MPIETAHQTAFTFRSDVEPSLRDARRSGILHALRTAEPYDKSGDGSVREEHAFAWLGDRTHENVELVVSHLVRYGFDEETMIFVPYSNLGNWLDRYPHACPYLECDEEGLINGASYFRKSVSNDNNPANPAPDAPVPNEYSIEYLEQQAARLEAQLVEVRKKLIESATGTRVENEIAICDTTEAEGAAHSESRRGEVVAVDDGSLADSRDSDEHSLPPQNKQKRARDSRNSDENSLSPQKKQKRALDECGHEGGGRDSDEISLPPQKEQMRALDECGREGVGHDFDENSLPPHKKQKRALDECGREGHTSDEGGGSRGEGSDGGASV